ncbi:hypothetical protein [Undibacterium danionis]|uniref:Uncharacterized protein n=1 Tax=Undibacterium danionis TaxID=1812100 RepID=A0ABV6IHK4_9BURK
MAFVVEKISNEELLSKYPEKYDVLKNHFPGEERLGFSIGQWIVDRDRDIYVFLMRCGEVREPDGYLVLFWGKSYVLAKEQHNSMCHWMEGGTIAEVLYISEEIMVRIEEVEALFDDAFNGSGWFGSSDDAYVSLTFPNAT